MERVFIHVFNVSVAASFLVLAILVYRLFAKGAPRWISVLLWGLLGLRLALPFHIESAVSLIPSQSTLPPTITEDRFPAIDTGFDAVDKAINPWLSESMATRPEYSANPMQVAIFVLSLLWLTVATGMLLYMGIGYIRLRLRMKEAIKEEADVYLSDHAKTPFILGVFHPRIYLPPTVTDKERPLVLAHERAHVARRDHVWKPLGFLLLAVYWFNPLLWVAYFLFCRDVESACDEKVIAALDEEERVAYAEALLALGVKGRGAFPSPPAFGEASVKSRVSAVASYKKPTVSVILVSLAVCLVFAACFLTYQKKKPVAIELGVWTASAVIGSSEKTVACDEVPHLVFTEGGDILIASGEEYVRLGKMSTARPSLAEYQMLLGALSLRPGYDAEYFDDAVIATWRASLPIGTGIGQEAVYLFRSKDALYIGYADGDAISSLYEFSLHEGLSSFLHTMRYVSEKENISLSLDTQSKTGRLLLGGDAPREIVGTYEFQNAKLIFTAKGSPKVKLVFLDLGTFLIFSRASSEAEELALLFPEGTALTGCYPLTQTNQAPKEDGYEIG